MIVETKKRSLTKTVVWRIIAILNSFLVLTFMHFETNIGNAIAMNITGFFIYYFYERIWNFIRWGKKYINESISNR